jgi:hypothetical protein
MTNPAGEEGAQKVEGVDVTVPPKETGKKNLNAPKETKEQNDKEAKIQAPMEVDGERVEFTESVDFYWVNRRLKYKKGDIVSVSKELRDVLLTRECVKLKPL